MGRQHGHQSGDSRPVPTERFNVVPDNFGCSLDHVQFSDRLEVTRSSFSFLEILCSIFINLIRRHG
jgi:hypothetical protein